MGLSHRATDKFRSFIVTMLSPVKEMAIPIKNELTPEEENRKLKLENQLLANELLYANQLVEARQAHYKKTLSHPVALPARVIFRPLDFWNNALWIDVGEADNERLQEKIVVKNSPVLSGHSIVGVIDYVGKHQSKVRLITDPGLCPSVRVARGGIQDSLIAEQVNTLSNSLRRSKAWGASQSEKEAVINQLHKVNSSLTNSKRTQYLAKGELKGSIGPSWRSTNTLLKGTGFNYDFPDEEGKARDLITGKSVGSADEDPIPILQLHDLLVTTGMDGVFPPHFKVAIVTKVELLKEGDYYYELEAEPTAGNLHELSLVFVIPPLANSDEGSNL